MNSKEIKDIIVERFTFNAEQARDWWNKYLDLAGYPEEDVDQENLESYHRIFKKYEASMIEDLDILVEAKLITMDQRQELFKDTLDLVYGKIGGE